MTEFGRPTVTAPAPGWKEWITEGRVLAAVGDDWQTTKAIYERVKPPQRLGSSSRRNATARVFSLLLGLRRQGAVESRMDGERTDWRLL